MALWGFTFDIIFHHNSMSILHKKKALHPTCNQIITLKDVGFMNNLLKIRVKSYKKVFPFF